MSTTKEDIAADIIANLDETEIPWLAVEIGNHYISNKTICEQSELAANLEVEGFSPAPFCRKKKAPKPH